MSTQKTLFQRAKDVAKSLASLSGAITVSAGLTLAGPSLAIEWKPKADVSTSSAAENDETLKRQKTCEALVSLSKRYDSSGSNHSAELQAMSDQLNSHEILQPLKQLWVQFAHDNDNVKTEKQLKILGDVRSDLYRAHLILRHLAENQKLNENSKQPIPTIETCLKGSGLEDTRAYITHAMNMAGEREKGIDIYAALKGNFHQACLIEEFAEIEKQLDEIRIALDEDANYEAKPNPLNNQTVTTGGAACDIFEALQKHGSKTYRPNRQYVNDLFEVSSHRQYPALRP